MSANLSHATSSDLPPPRGLPRFHVVLHYYAGQRDTALRLVQLHGACILTQPVAVRGMAWEGCVAVEVLIEASYAVVERLQDVLGLSVLSMKSGRFQVGYPAVRSERINGGQLDAIRRGQPAAHSARPAVA